MRARLSVFVLALVCLVAIEVAGAVFHRSIVPARLTICDLWMTLPVALCLVVGCLIRDHIRRAVFGLAQAILLLHVYANHFSRTISLGSDTEVRVVYAAWIGWLLAYTAVFTFITYLVGRCHRAGQPGYCSVCGYDLRGLPERRCPECGQPF